MKGLGGWGGPIRYRDDHDNKYRWRCISSHWKNEQFTSYLIIIYLSQLEVAVLSDIIDTIQFWMTMVREIEHTMMSRVSTMISALSIL